MIAANLDATRVAIIGPGRRARPLPIKLARDNKRVAVYYHNSDVCKAINRTHLIPIHLTEDLALRRGGMDQVPRLGPESLRDQRPGAHRREQ
jgi:glycerol-3-phosphate dehydrogenase (NAD(P)+)